MNQKKFLTSVGLFCSAFGLSLVSSIFAYQRVGTASPMVERNNLSEQKKD